MYLFGIVGTLVLADIIFLIPPSVISKSTLRREYEEIEGNDVSVIVVDCIIDQSMCMTG